MSSEWIVNDASFYQIKDSHFLNFNTLTEFLENNIYYHSNKGILLKNFSDIFVLVACYHSENFVHANEKKWKDILTKTQYRKLQENGYYIIAYMLISKKNEQIKYIDIFETIVPKYNLGEVMILKYDEKTNYQFLLVPQIVIKSSAKYWCKILDLNDATGKTRKELIDNFIQDAELEQSDLDWKYLYDLCD